MSSLQPGDEFAGFVIERALGAGGMGEVYLARHPRLPRKVALKLLSSTLTGDDAFRTRFGREADLVAGLSHPNIVKVYDRGETDGRLWIALQFIDGRDLTAAGATEPLPVRHVAALIGEVAVALDEAGRHGLVHRDVKPANILLDGQGHAHLTDFGIARLADDNQGLTATGVAVGTVAYASPEQLQGLAVDARSDQYSLAATAFALLTGTTVYPGTNPVMVSAAHAHDPIPAASSRRVGLGAAVDQVLIRALAKDPAHRYPDSRTFAADLDRALAVAPSSQPIAPEPVARVPESAGPTLPVASAQPAKRRRAVLIGGAAAVVVALVAVLVVTLSGGDDGEVRAGQEQSVSDAGPTDVSPEAAELEQILVSPLLPSLAQKPAKDRWVSEVADTVDDLAVMGGTDRYVVIGEYKGSGEVALYIVDAESGRRQHSVTFAGDYYLMDQKCRAFESIESVVCQLDNYESFTILDLERGTASPVLDIESRSWAVTGDTVFFRTSSEVLAYGVDGRQRWRAPLAYPLGVDEAQPVNGSPVVEVVNGAVTSLRRVSDGKELYRRDTTLDLGSSPNAELRWLPFAGGFAVADSGSTAFFDADGRRTGSVSGWEPIEYRDMLVAGTPAAAPSLPIVVADGSVAAVNPATGTVLWKQSVSDTGTPQLAGAFGTDVMVEDFAGNLWLNCYTGVGTRLNAAMSPVGGDGERVAMAGGAEPFRVYDRDGAVVWEEPQTPSTGSIRPDFLAIGGGLYYGARRIL